MTPDDVAYRASRENITALLADGVVDLPVPACPEWTVRDLVAHLVSVCARALGRVPPPDASLDAWEELGEALDTAVRGGLPAGGLVMDAFTHEVDLRYALGAPVPTEHVAYDRTLEVLTRGFGASVRGRGLPAVRVVCDGTEWFAGKGEAAVTLTGTRHDLHRALAGRRTYAQIAALAWSDDPGRWLPAFTWGPFTPPLTPGDVRG